MDGFNNNGYGEQPDYLRQQNQAQHPASQNQANYGGGAYNMGAPGPKKKSRGGLVAAMISICLACVILGGVIGGFVISTNRPADATPSQSEPVGQSSQAMAPAPSNASEPSPVPELGGEALNLAMSDNLAADIYEQLAPAVVGIKVSQKRFVRGSSTTEQEISYASGIIISNEGHILTNNHVVESGDTFDVELSDGKTAKAELIGGDKFTDTAVLKIEPFEGMVVAPLGDSSTVRTGENIIVIGNPTGESLARSLTGGYVSEAKRETALTTGDSIEMIQIDAAINPGSSGGPVINNKGEVIGMTTLKRLAAGIDSYGNTISADGLGFAIPINTAKETAEQLIANGEIEHPGIGISGATVTDSDAETWNIVKGVMVASVTEGGPADNAGIRTYDVITGVDGQKVETIEGLKEILGSKKVGDTVTIHVWRDGFEKDMSVSIGNMNRM